MTETQTAPDISGVPTRELAALYAEHIGLTEVTNFAFRVGIDTRDLKKIVVSQAYAFTGLRLADLLLTELGLNIGALEQREEIHVVPRWASMKCALQMVDEELRAKAEGILFFRLEDETNEEIEAALTVWIAQNSTAADRTARAQELIALRHEHVQMSDEQKTRSKSDSRRARGK